MIRAYLHLISSEFPDASLPIVISTGLGKNITENSNMEWSLSLFRKKLPVGRNVIVNKAYHSLRELNAAADLVVMRRAVKFIGVSTSTFSTFIASTFSLGASTLIPTDACKCRSREASLLSSFTFIHG